MINNYKHESTRARSFVIKQDKEPGSKFIQFPWILISED